MLNLTFFGKVVFVIAIIVVIIVSAYLGFGDGDKTTFKERWLTFLACFAIGTLIVYGIGYISSWYNTNTAAGQRAIKDDVSNMTGGLDRKITIIYYGQEDKPIEFEGKIDLKEKEDQKVLEFVMDGKKYIYYIGMLDRYIVEEK